MVRQVVQVQYDGSLVGALSFDTETGLGAFEYEPNFVDQGVQLAPLKMPLLKQKIYSFPGLAYETFKGLPGLLADCLPDDFGNAVLNAWVASQGRSPNQISPLERLQYTGKRGMGALEFIPAMQHKNLNASQDIELESLVAIAQEILDDRESFNISLQENVADKNAMQALLSVGMSAGGARPKAVVAFNADFSQVRSGQVDVPAGFTHHVIKFDGVNQTNENKETFGDPQGYGSMEYVYYLMAQACGIDMMPSHLLDEGPRRHFITQRFDRQDNKKIHIQTLNGLAHVDYKQPGSFSYAELFSVARELKLSASDAKELLRRLIFNIVARNHDDHSKNFSFILRDKKWQLSPAYDVAYSYQPGSRWVNSHWMSLNGKREDFTRADLYTLEKISLRFSKNIIDAVIDRTVECVSQWRTLAKINGVPKELIKLVESNLRLNL